MIQVDQVNLVIQVFKYTHKYIIIGNSGSDSNNDGNSDSSNGEHSVSNDDETDSNDSSGSSNTGIIIYIYYYNQYISFSITCKYYTK